MQSGLVLSLQSDVFHRIFYIIIETNKNVPKNVNIIPYVLLNKVKF